MARSADQVGTSLKRWARERTTVLLLAMAVPVGALGSGVIYLADRANWATHSAIALGSGLVATGGVALLWELVGRRRFADEMLQETAIAQSVKLAGVLAVEYDLNDTRPIFAEAFKGVSRVDLSVVYSTAWRSIHGRDMTHFLEKSASQMRVVLPNPGNRPVMEEIAARFGLSTEKVIQRVEDATEYYRELQSNAPRCNSVQLFHLDAVPMYSYYRVGDTLGVWIFENQRERPEVNPILLCDRRGKLGDFFATDYERLLTQDHCTHSEAPQLDTRREWVKEGSGEVGV